MEKQRRKLFVTNNFKELVKDICDHVNMMHEDDNTEENTINVKPIITDSKISIIVPEWDNYELFSHGFSENSNISEEEEELRYKTLLIDGLFEILLNKTLNYNQTK